jgi:D-threonate/D-erythronate kinase
LRTKSPNPVIVIADDLSGAAELAGIAFARGCTAEVQREFDPTSNAEVIAVDTDSRHLAPEAAAKQLEQVARAVIAAKPAWIYKKVDSVLRGNVRVEV